MTQRNQSQHADNTPGEPITCTLGSSAQQIQRVADFRQAFEHLQRTERIEGGFRWHFLANPEQEVFLRQLAEREHDCCSFFAFTITREGPIVVWETRAPDVAARVLDAFKGLPEKLESGAEHDALKSAFAAAGLRFTASCQRNSW